MPPKKLKSREGNAQLPEVSKFPFRVGEEVEMKSFESGYRGAWFRVQIKKIRLDRKGSILCTMGYRDYTDESEEEISAFEKDPASDQRILMVRPLPPPSVKESQFNKSVHTKMCAVYRDEWEIGDLVDWWYHCCWWAAKVISVVGDGRFQLVCPAPPGGEGGVYLANSRDLRPSLKWSIGAQWTAPPSKEIGKRPCARIVWLLDSNEVAEFASPNQDRVPQKRGRPKLMRLVNPPLDRKETAVFKPLNSDRGPGKSRRPRVMELARLPFRTHNQGTAEVATLNKDTKVPQKRGRPRKVEGHEEAAKKRRRPIVIKIIHPRQDPAYEQVEHLLKKSSADERNVCVKDEGTFDIHPEHETRQGSMQEFMMTGRRPGDEDIKWVEKARDVTERQPERGNRLGIEHKTSVLGRQILEEKRQGIKQKRSVMRMSDKINMTRENRFSNGHCDEAKRRKLEHITRIAESQAGDEHEKKQSLKDQQDGKKPQTSKNDVTDQEERKAVQKMEDDKVAVKTMLMSHVGGVVVHHMLDLVPREHISLPCLDEGKETSGDQSSGQQSKGEKQNGELQVEVFTSNFASNPVNGEVKMLEEDLSVGEAYKEALDLKVLKVLNAYEEAFSDTVCLEGKNSDLTHDPSAKKYKDVPMNDTCSTGQKSVIAPKDMSVVKAYEEAFIKDIQSPRMLFSQCQDSLPATSKLAKSREYPVSCNQKKSMKVPKVSSPCKGVSSIDTKSRSLQGRLMENAANLSHTLVIGRETSCTDTISVGGSQESFSGRVVDIGAGEPRKDSASSHGGTSLVEDGESGSSLNLESSRGIQSRKSATHHLAAGGMGMKTEKSNKNELFPARKKIPKPVMKMNHKFSLSRKLIDQARREVSAKRRRSLSSTGRG